MLRDVYLYGAPGREFGRHFRIAVDSPREAVRALEMLRPGLRQVFHSGYWRFIVGSPHITNSVGTLNMHLGSQPLHIVPATRPHDGDGIGKIALGVVIIGAAIVLSPFTGGGSLALGAALAETAFMGISYGSIALMGAAAVLGGVATMISPRPPQQQPSDFQPTSMAAAEDRPSYMFNGAVNNTTQGGPVPLVFGDHLVGSVVASGSLNAEDIPV